MNRLNRIAILASLSCIGGIAHAQVGWGDFCIDPENTDPRPAPYIANYIGNDFIILGAGATGTATYGGQNGPCYGPTAHTLPLEGRLGFMIGPVGSVQTDFDDLMALTTGMPTDPGGDYCFGMMVRDGEQVLIGSGGVGQFVGASYRYVDTTWVNGQTQVRRRARVVGDAVRLEWKFTNLSATDNQTIGMKFCAYTGMRTSNGVTDQAGNGQSGSDLGTSGPGGTRTPNFIELPGQRPPITEKNWLNSSTNFPSQANFQWSQWMPYGMRVDNVSTPATSDASEVYQFIIGNHGFSSPTAGLFFTQDGNPTNVRGRLGTDDGQGDPALTDTFDPLREDSDILLGEVSFVQVFRPETVAPQTSRTIVHYIRSPWSVGDYVGNYTALVDAPRIVEPNSSGTNGLTPNPLTIAAYVDNQYADINRQVPLVNVRFTINFPEGSGLALAPGETQTKTVAQVLSNNIANVTWNVVADGEAVGELPYTVTVAPANTQTKTLTGKVLVAATPKLRLPEGATLVTIPWGFSDTSLDAIFGPIGDPDALRFGVDYVAYRWDPNTGAYLPTSTVRRGDSVWIVCNNDEGYRALNGALTPTDQGTGGLQTSLQPGWNMIGNPYPFAVPLGQLLGVGLTDPTNVLTWKEMVDNGWVSPSLAYWQRSVDDPSTGFYSFTTGSADVLQPQRGYWVYVTTPLPVRVSWPPVYAPGLSNTLNRGAAAQPVKTVWKQTDKQWRLQLVARTSEGLDSQNFIGLAANTATAKSLKAYKPPASPNAKVELAIADVEAGKPTRLAASFAERPGRKSWKVVARALEPGEITLTWPNIATLPKNVRLSIKDEVNGTTRDLRFQSGYTFNMEEVGSREFTVTMEPGGATRALIGNVTVSRPSRDINGPIAINYALSSEAVTTVRILGAGGKEVYTVSRGRAASAGENSVTWALRDNANRAVAPGTYQVEIVAETSTGERVRKLVPVNVVR